MPEIEGFPDELVQVWTNFIHNAIQAMKGKGNLAVVVASERNGVRVSVVDSGSGIPPEIQEKMFDAFFTTKRSEGGSGLGTHIMYNLVTQTLKGSINATSEIGEGLRYLIRFPQK